MRNPARTLFALTLAGLLAFGLIGCAGTTAEPAEPEGAVETTEVKIGFAAPLTGDNALYGEGMKLAVQIAIDEANASEAAQNAGFSFALNAQDDAADPKQAVNVASALAGDPKVVGVVGHFNSGCSIPAAPVYEDASLAMVTVSSKTALTSTGLMNVNRIVAKDDAQGGFAGKLAMDLGNDSVSLIDDGTPYGQGLASEFKKAYEAAGGKVASEDRIQPKEVDFSALVTKVKSAKSAAVYYAGAHTEGALITRQMKESGLKIPVIGGDMLYTPEYVEIAGAANAEGDMATSLGLPLDQQPKGVEFAQKYQENYGKAPEAYDSYAYDAAWAIITAVINAGDDRAAVMKAVRAGSHDGVTGVVAFDENGDNKQQVISAFKVTDSKWAQIEQ